jgi:hypothetical protein
VDNKEIGYMKMSLREMICEDCGWMKLIQDGVQSWKLVFGCSTSASCSNSKATERSLMDGGDDGAQGFPLYA